MRFSLYFPFLLALLLLGSAAFGAPAQRSLKLLFLSRTSKMDAQYLDELKAADINVTQRGLTEAISLAEFKSYNLVVIPDFITLDEAFNVGAVDVPTWWDVTLPNLRAYVQQGGGVLIASFLYGGGEGLATAYNRMLTPWGAAFKAQQIIDPAHIALIDPQITDCAEKPGKAVKDSTFYCWTERLAKHPATQDIKRIYYPVVNMRWDDCYTTPPIVLYDKAWTPLVRAMAKSGVYNTKTDKGYQWLDSMGTDDVLAATRTIGKGRVALWSINSYFTFFRPYTKDASYGENHHGPIDGILLKKGDGKVPADDGKLLVNLYQWLAEPGVKAGFGGPTPAPLPAPPTAESNVTAVINWDTLKMPPTWRHRPLLAKINGQMYYDEQADVTIKGDLHYYKALVGVHSAFSDGKGTVAEYAAAAKKAGYSLIAFTEQFESLGEKNWTKLVTECAKNSTDTFVCLPGIDIGDAEGGRYLAYGQPNYPAKSWLTADGKFFSANNVLSLGFSTHMSVIAHPQHSPHQYRMFKHFQGIAAATYKDGKLVDDGLEAYAWQVSSGSTPIPIAVHEVMSPTEVAQAAQTGFQQIMPADTVLHAADYFRCGLSHFFDTPPRYFISEGPIIDTWTIFNKDQGKPEEQRNRYRIALGAKSDVPLKEVVLYAEGQDQPIIRDGQNATPFSAFHHASDIYRRWQPNATTFQQQVDGYVAWQHHWYMMVTDDKGRRALSPQLRTVPDRYIVRCGDRQNWLGYVAMYYTGTPLRDVDVHMPVLENKDGDGSFTYETKPGDFLAPMLDFPFASDRACMETYLLEQRYLNANKFGDVCYDAAPMRISVPTRLYYGRIRTTDFTSRSNTPENVDGYLYQINLITKMDATRANDDPVWPWFNSVTGKYYVHTDAGWQTGEITDATRFDLHRGDIVGDLMILCDNMRLAGKHVGLIAPADKAVKAGAQFAASFFQFNKMFGENTYNKLQPYDVAAHFPELVKAMGFDGPTPYTLTLTRGTLTDLQLTAHLSAMAQGVAGQVRGAAMPFNLPLCILGLNPRWSAGVWRSDAPANIADQFPVIDVVNAATQSGTGYTTLDVTKDVAFYAGNFLTADNPDLFLNVETWTKDGISVEVNNPTDKEIIATIQTPAEIALKQLKKTLTIPAGATVRVKE